MIGLEQWRAAIGGWYSGNMSAIYRRYGSRRIVRNWPKLLQILDINFTIVIYYSVCWLIVVLFALMSQDGLFVALSLAFDNNCGYPQDLCMLVKSPATTVFRVSHDCIQRFCVFVDPTVAPVLRTCRVQLRRSWKQASPSATPMLGLLLALNWLLIVAGDVELNPGPVPPGITDLLPTVDASVLTEADICDVLDEVESLAGRWRGMCIRLGLLPSDIDTIAKMHHHNPHDCLMEVLVKWLKMSYNTQRHGLPTWQKVVAVVANRIGGDNPALAKLIAENHQGISIVQIANTQTQTQEVERSPTQPCLDPRETNDLYLKFASAFRRIIEIMNKSVDVEGLKDFLDLCSHPLYPEKSYVDCKIYKGANTPRELLKSLSPQFINYMNYRLLEGIIEEFKCHESKQVLEQYKHAFMSTNPKGKRKRALEDFPDPISDSEIEQTSGVKKVRVILDGKMEEATFETVQETQTALHSVSGIDKASIMYASHDPGSVILNFLLPESICHILHELNEEDLAILAGARIMKLEMDEFVIDNIQECATKESTISQIQATGESTKPTSLEYYLHERQNEMQLYQYSHLCEMLDLISDETLKGLCSESFLSAYASCFRNWKRVAPYIGLNDWRIQQLVDSYPNDKDQKRAALQCWKRRERDNATYHNLLETLLLHGEIEDIKTLLYQMGPDLTVTQTSKWLKHKYLCCDNQHEWKGLARLMIFNQTLGHIKKDPLKQLSVLDYSVYYDTLDQFPTQVASISLKSFINCITATTKPILIKGIHGIGISQLISRICCYWSKEFGLRRYKLLLWINLAVIRNPPASLYHLLQEVLPARFGVQHISKWIESSDGEDILFVLDGWSQKQEKATNNVFSRLLSKQYLKKCTIVVTSPFLTPTKPLLRVGSQTVMFSDCIQFDVFGLNPIQISQQVINHFASDPAKAEEFLRYIASQSNISQLTSIPICLFGLLCVSDCVPESELPVTWTEFFSAMTLLFLSPLFPECEIDNYFSQYLRNFPHHVPKATRPFLCCLSRIAYFGIQNGENAFSQETLGSTLPLLTSQQTGFVFLQPEYYPLSSKHGNKCLHFTFPLLQDFLAALHVHTLSKSEQKHLMKNRHDLVYLWQFFSGLTATDQYRKHFPILQNTYCKHDYKKVANCSYEAKVSAEIEIDLSYDSLCRRDIYHLVALSQGTTILNMKFSHCSLALHLSKLHPLFLPSKSAVGGQHLCIELEDCTVSAEGLFLGRIPVQKLSVRWCNIGSEESRALGRTLKVNHSLKELDLGSNKIGNSGATAIAEGLSQNTSLENLSLLGNGISDDGAIALARALNVNNYLKILDLQTNEIQDEGAKAIAAALRMNHSLTILMLRYNVSSSVMKESLHNEFKGRVQI